MTIRDLIDELIALEAKTDASDHVAVEMDTDGTTWWGSIDRVDRDEDGVPTIRAYVP